MRTSYQDLVRMLDPEQDLLRIGAQPDPDLPCIVLPRAPEYTLRV